ncbi:MAG: ABC transporter substrate-binding protein [Acetobacteraceae bacterium]
MFDNLIRRDPRDGKSIIPDLAHSWEISKDGTSYTFFLRKDVPFHDGAEMTSEDVKATFDRIVKPPAGISIPRSALFTAVSEITAPDKYTVQFKLSEPRSVNFIMSSIATGWNVIVRKKTLEDNAYNLRRVLSYPGTGPYTSVAASRTKYGCSRRTRTTGTRGCRTSTASSSTTPCPSRRRCRRRCWAIAWITCG